MSEPVCPFGDGRHKRKVWAENTEGRIRSGFSCVRCHKTWEHTPDGVKATYDIYEWPRP